MEHCTDQDRKRTEQQDLAIEFGELLRNATKTDSNETAQAGQNTVIAYTCGKILSKCKRSCK